MNLTGTMLRLLQYCNTYSGLKSIKGAKTDLAYIHVNLCFLSQSITKLEMKTNLLYETIKEINDIQDKLQKSTARKLMQ
jgi:hypothetical protein